MTIFMTKNVTDEINRFLMLHIFGSLLDVNALSYLHHFLSRHQKVLTDYFPIRRSSRTPSNVLKVSLGVFVSGKKATQDLEID